MHVKWGRWRQRGEAGTPIRKLRSPVEKCPASTMLDFLGYKKERFVQTIINIRCLFKGYPVGQELDRKTFRI